MKLPPPTPPPPAYEGREKGLTKRMIAGAAGGMLGVDYEDSRRPDPATERSPERSKGSRKAAGREPPANPNAVADAQQRGVNPENLDGGRVVSRDASAPEAPKARKKKQARDRLTVDKDAPELRKKKEQQEERDEPEVFKDGVDTGFAAPVELKLDAPSGPEPGDPTLTDADEIQRAFGSTVGYANHVMLLAEAFRRETGASRAEALEYLASMFVAPSDLGFGLLALKEFGPSTGILDIYPLEVVEHLLVRHPNLWPKVSMGSFFAAEADPEAPRHTDTKTPLVLRYDPSLRIRGFALEGGGRPGYKLEPGDADGEYRLSIDSPGEYSLLLSAVSRTGHTAIERVRVIVRLAKGDAPPPPEPSPYPERDATKVEAWPKPPPREIATAPATRPRSAGGSLMSAAEIIHRRTKGALAKDGSSWPED